MKRISTRRILFFALLLSSACGKGEPGADSTEQGRPVRTAFVELRHTAGSATYSGSVEPIERVRLATKVTAWVAEIPHEEGEKVRKGQLLVKLRNEDLEAKRTQARAALNEAHIHFDNARKNFKRIEALHAKGAATQKELDDMQGAYASAEAALSAAESMKIEIDEGLKYSELRAAFDGVVSRKFLDVGDLASPGQPIIEFENTTTIKVVASVPEQDIQALKTGDPVRLQIEAAAIGSNGENRQAVIERIGPAADPMSRQFQMQVVADNADGAVRTGMFARVLTGQAGEVALLVPQSAVFRRGQLQGVHVVNAEGRAVLRWIQTGPVNGGFVEVLSGLSSGERVVVDENVSLRDGEKIEVKE